MGQYWYPVNLDKREFINPHALGCGLELWEQGSPSRAPGVQTALFAAVTAMPEQRGGGDFDPHPWIGRWVGDRVVIVGDYAEDDDIPNSPIPASEIYAACSGDEGAFADVSELAVQWLEQAFEGRFTGDGWRRWTFNGASPPT